MNGRRKDPVREQNEHEERPVGAAEDARESGSDNLPDPNFSYSESNREIESLGFIRGRDADYFVEDDPRGDGAVPIENLFSSAGIDELRREGGSPLETLGRVEGVDAEMPSDEIVHENLRNAITNEIGEEPELLIEIEGDQVILSGTVSSAESRDRAEMTALSVSGVGTVVNDIAVRDSRERKIEKPTV